MLMDYLNSWSLPKGQNFYIVRKSPIITFVKNIKQITVRDIWDGKVELNVGLLEQKHK